MKVEDMSKEYVVKYYTALVSDLKAYIRDLEAYRMNSEHNEAIKELEFKLKTEFDFKNSEAINAIEENKGVKKLKDYYFSALDEIGQLKIENAHLISLLSEEQKLMLIGTNTTGGTQC